MAAEKNFENKVKAYLSSKGIYKMGMEHDKMTVSPIGYYEKRFANRMTKKGLPDMHIVVGGKSIEVEVKADNGKPSDIQLFMINQINESGGCAFVLYPSAFNDFKKFIEKEIDKITATTYRVPVIWK